MSVGRVWRDEVFRYTDPKSGRTVSRLTDYLGHSHHLYFTDACWVEDNRSFIFVSDRENSSDLFLYDLEESRILQLTDLRSRERPGGVYSKANRAHYFWQGRILCELDIDKLQMREIYRAPEGFTARKTLDVTADGRYVCLLLQEEDPEQSQPRISYAYSRFVEFFEKRPLSRIMRLDVASGSTDVVHEERCYLGHLNASPRQPSLMTFCHEGPWDRVEQRIWGLDVLTGRLWKVRPQAADEAVGHEYWLADGEMIGYHGRRGGTEGRESFFGAIRWDNTRQVEFSFPFHSTHFCSNDLDLIVGDGTAALTANAKPYIMLFKRTGDQFAGPRILAFHRSTFNDQHAHPHPRLTPDGTKVLYSSDLTGYSNIYIVEVGDFEELPPVS